MTDRLPGDWGGIQSITTFPYTCGHVGCGHNVASERGWATNNSPGGRIHMCPMCNRPTFVDHRDESRQVPGAPIGREVGGLPPDVERVYHEARTAATAGAYTAAILTCRKLLMHIAVDKDAKPNEGFLYYAKYLVDNHWVPPGSDPWVEHWRAPGNEANHELVTNSLADAEELLTFVEHILINVYELPSRMPSAASSPASS